MTNVSKIYECAREIYGECGIDTDAVLVRLADMPLSIHAWQGDDVVGFESTGHSLTGGCQVTGNYPGRARTSDELRKDIEQALGLIAGKRLRVCLQGHEVDKVFPGKDRDAFTLDNFSGWLDWAAEKGLGMDIAPAYYSHPKLDMGLSLSHPDAAIRRFWIDHGKACRRIGAEFGKRLGTPAVCNVWVPDGFKDIPADRCAPRERLLESLDATFEEKFPETQLLDAVESKLFGIGVESYTVGSNDRTDASSCTSAEASAGTATTLSFLTILCLILLASPSETTMAPTSSLRWIISMPPSTALRHGLSAHAAGRKPCLSQCSSRKDLMRTNTKAISLRAWPIAKPSRFFRGARSGHSSASRTTFRRTRMCLLLSVNMRRTSFSRDKLSTINMSVRRFGAHYRTT